jgi:hypothetical protein
MRWKDDVLHMKKKKENKRKKEKYKTHLETADTAPVSG